MEELLTTIQAELDAFKDQGENQICITTRVISKDDDGISFATPNGRKKVRKQEVLNFDNIVVNGKTQLIILKDSHLYDFIILSTQSPCPSTIPIFSLVADGLDSKLAFKMV